MKLTLLFALALGLFTSVSEAAPKESTESKKAPAKEEKTSKSPGKKPIEPQTDEEKLAAAKKLSDGLTPTQRTKLLDLLNKGDSKALQEINGVGEKRAASIIAKRPYSKIEDLALTDDIGEKTFTNVVAFGKGEQPVKKAEEKKASPAKKM